MGVWLAAAIMDLYSSHSEIRGLEELDFPVVFRDDEGYCHFVEDGSQFLNHFELQDLADEQFRGWDSRGRAFHFIAFPNSISVYPEIGMPEFGDLRENLVGFFAKASDYPGWLSPESHQKLKNWLNSLPRGNDLNHLA